MANAAEGRALGRRFLLRVFAAACALAPVSALAATGYTPGGHGDARLRLARILPASAGATLAARLRDACGSQAATNRMFAPELSRLVTLAQAPVDDASLAGEIKGMIAADFAAGRTVTLDGWLLSRSELALCHAVHDGLPRKGGAGT